MRRRDNRQLMFTFGVAILFDSVDMRLNSIMRLSHVHDTHNIIPFWVERIVTRAWAARKVHLSFKYTDFYTSIKISSACYDMKQL